MLPIVNPPTNRDSPRFPETQEISRERGKSGGALLVGGFTVGSTSARLPHPTHPPAGNPPLPGVLPLCMVGRDQYPIPYSIRSTLPPLISDTLVTGLAQGPQMAAHWEHTSGPKFSSFGGLQIPLTKTRYTTPHYYPKYEMSLIVQDSVIGNP